MFKVISFLIICLIFFCCPLLVSAQDITILYTGESHASLYPCHCPSSPDGGLLRRSTKIKEIRKGNPNVLLVDSGGFFAGGTLDTHSLNTDLDKTRTQITLKAMDLMGYDAVAVGDDEFNFGSDFLFDEISKTKFPFLSSNIKSDKFLPYIIKEINGVKFGILALTSEDTAIKSGLEIIDPKEALPSTIKQLKGKGADIIILLSHLGEDTDTQLVNEIVGIDIIITGHKITGQKEPYAKINSTLFLRPAGEARRLGRCDLKIDNKKIVDFKVEQIHLNSEIKDDESLKKIVPECFSDNDCWKPKFKGKCVSPATNQARCEFTEVPSFDLLIIRPIESKFPFDATSTIELIRRFLPKVKAEYIDYPNRRADGLIKKLKIKMLPAYILPKQIEQEQVFSNMKHIVDKQDEFYLVKPSFAGVSFFVGRKRIENRLDIFLTLKEKEVDKLLEVIKALVEKDKSSVDVHIHFLAVSTKDGFKAQAGDELIEEYLRQVCVMHHYPLRWWDYAICRAKNITSSWWDDCLKNMDLELIKSEARSGKGRELLRENIKLGEELEISNSPTFLFENQEVFSAQAIPTVEELENILLREVK